MCHAKTPHKNGASDSLHGHMIFYKSAHVSETTKTRNDVLSHTDIHTRIA